jgi:UDP-N-acetyl-D-mannosaminuronic acid transferase (WecB/TagA/CpsF family)
MPDVDRCVTRILGIDFFHGTAREAVERMRGRGGLLVVPAAPALKDLDTRADYREALLSADMALTDSAFMVLIWNQLQEHKIRRLSGLEYLRELLRHEDVRRPGNTLWVMAGEASAQCNLEWLRGEGVTVPQEYVYIAPMYGAEVEDPLLLQRLQKLQPRHVIVTIGGGKQEQLGLYLRRNLTYVPSIHCIGAAIAFLSGDQVHIPVWADRYYMGWLFRSISEPKRYLPRYWDARKLFRLMVRYRDQLPELVSAER